MLKVLIDARMRSGGVGRYVSLLRESFAARSDVEPAFYEEGNAFVPWNRLRLTGISWRTSQDVFHGTHLEIPPALRVPAVVTIHDLIPLADRRSMPSRFRREVFSSLVRTARRRASRVVVPSYSSADELRSHGFDSDSIEVIPLAPSAVFRPVDGREQELARAIFAGGHPYVATVVTGKAHKNADLLGNLAEGIFDEARRIFSVRGYGRSTDVCRFVPRLDDEGMRLFYGGADLFLSLSSREGFGLPLLEAASCGTPVAADPSLGVVAFLEGVVPIDVDDPQGVLRIATTLLKDDSYRELSGSLVRESSRGLSLKRFGDSTVAVYQEVLGG